MVQYMEAVVLLDSLQNTSLRNNFFFLFFGVRANFSMLKAVPWYDRYMMVDWHRCKNVLQDIKRSYENSRLLLTVGMLKKLLKGRLFADIVLIKSVESKLIFISRWFQRCTSC